MIKGVPGVPRPDSLSRCIAFPQAKLRPGLATSSTAITTSPWRTSPFWNDSFKKWNMNHYKSWTLTQTYSVMLPWLLKEGKQRGGTFWDLLLEVKHHWEPLVSIRQKDQKDSRKSAVSLPLSSVVSWSRSFWYCGIFFLGQVAMWESSHLESQVSFIFSEKCGAVDISGRFSDNSP